jgi:hypothetical protein
MDSLLEVLSTSEEDHHCWVPYYLALGDLAAADSVIQWLLAEEGGNPSLTTQLYQLRLSVMAGLNQQDPAYVTWLRELIEADPYGAMAPKALLRHVTREPYMRCPWKLDDDLPGIRSMEAVQQPGARTALTLYPNPTAGTFGVMHEDGTVIRSIRMYSTEGRELRLNHNKGHYDPGPAQPGLYLLVVEQADGHFEQLRLILTAP